MGFAFINEINRLQRLFEETEKSLHEQIKQTEEENATKSKRLEALKTGLKEEKIKNESLAQELKSAKLKVSELTSNISSLEQFVCVNDDIKHQFDTTKEKVTHFPYNFYIMNSYFKFLRKKRR